ncbi:MAG: PqqD family protein [Acidobacteria bacterium]|nr:PqqD family protein [Acidobacteriota bacterium]MBI3426264.1 PqqD family protein [Acidobacteriota bacterium]
MQQTITPKAQASFTELQDDREAIILDLENLHYYTLNAAAILLWKNLRSGAAQTAEALSAALASAFKLDLAQAERNTRDWLAEMARNGLIEYTNAQAAVARAFTPSSDLPPYEAPQLKLSNALTSVVLSGSAIVGPSAITGG